MSEHARPLEQLELEVVSVVEHLADVVRLPTALEHPVDDPAGVELRARLDHEDELYPLVFRTLEARNHLRPTLAQLEAIDASGLLSVRGPLAGARRLLDELDAAARASSLLLEAEPGTATTTRPPTARQVVRELDPPERPNGMPPARPCASLRHDGARCRAYALPWSLRPLCAKHATASERAHNAERRAAWEATR